ncbi:MAG: helix-turn-helix domain-containing protein [Candidatus Pacebacteria bacterium]|nr:helix-turn-helix domain-containing protein [Candidatus Paceibacterota bacterium]
MNVKRIYKEKLEENDTVHPGKILSTVLLKYNINQKELSLRIGLTKKAINEIIKGKNPITKKTSEKLEKVFPISASF